MKSSGARCRGAAVALSAVIAAAGCASSHPAAAPASHAPPASTQPASAASTPPASPARIRALAARYLAIARPANHRLDEAVDGFTDHRRDDLAKAVADLRAQAATERQFDAQLARIRFPAAIEAIARALIRANRSRIALTLREAQVMSVAGLRAFDRRHKAADAAVEVPVRALRKALGLPPPENS
jgi:beta-lactamase class A